MTTAMETGGRPAKRGRFALIDIARGLAIIGMIVYHFAWDLGFLGFISVNVSLDFGWILFQRLLVSTFLFLVGVGLVLGHGRGIRWQKFWRRFAVILGAALVVSAGTFAMFPESFVYFGILHAIAIFSLLALPFLFAPVWLLLALAAAILILPTVFTSPVFTNVWLSWIGMWEVPPRTEDLVPLFPWFALVLIGIAATRLAQGTGIMDRVAAVPARGPLPRALIKAGRWSLIIYLLHQLVMLAVLVPLANVVQPGTQARAQGFMDSCLASCGEASGDSSAAYCTSYCRCTLDRVQQDDLWPLLSRERSPEEDRVIGDMTNQCASDALMGFEAE